MPISEFELYHGVVLVRLMRSDRPVSLRLVETNPQDCWSAYKLNEEVQLYIKYCAKPALSKSDNGTCTWKFTFTKRNLTEIQHLEKDRAVYFALVGIYTLPMPVQSENRRSQVCLLTPDEYLQCVGDDISTNKVISVKFDPKKSLRVWGNHNGKDKPLIVAANSLDKWEIPGS